MSDSSLLEEPLLKDLEKEVVSELGAVYGNEVLKGVQELLKDATPFKMATLTSIFFYLFVGYFHLLFSS